MLHDGMIACAWHEFVLLRIRISQIQLNCKLFIFPVSVQHISLDCASWW